MGILAATLALWLSACGSQLEPESVYGAGAGTGNGVTPAGAGLDAGADLGGGDLGGGDLSSGGDLPGSDATGSGGGAGGSGDSGSGGAGGSGGSDGSGTPSGPGGGGAKAADCDGFKNQKGITDTEILIGNSVDISGPVPGLFEASQDAIKAYVSYFNSTSDICGRKLKLITYDSRTDAGADQQAYTRACDEVFAMVASTSAFDSGGAGTAQECGLPDVRSATLSQARAKCTTCFGAQSVNTYEFENAVADYILKNFGSAGQHAGFLYINAGSAAENAPIQASAMTQRGMHFDVLQGVDIAEFNYAPYVQKLKDAKVEVVFWTGAYQQSVKLRQAMVQQDYQPKVYMRDPTDYIDDYVKSGGSAVEGTYIFTNFTPFEEADKNPEMAKYLGYLQRSKPGATPTFFGVFSWSAGILFTQKAQELGGRLTRESLVAALGKTDNWTGNGIHSKQHVGTKHSGDCWRFLQLRQGQWVPAGSTDYLCNGLTVGDPKGP